MAELIHGTPDEMRAVGQDPSKIHTCSMPEKGGNPGNPGCPAAKSCGEKPWSEGRRPCYLGVEILTPIEGGAGFKSRKEIVHCWTAYAAKKQAKYNGITDPNDEEEIIPQIVQVLAREGEEFDPGDTKVVAQTNGTSIVQADDKRKIVPAFPKPWERTQYRNSMSAQAAIKRLKGEREAEDTDRIIGLGESRERDEATADGSGVPIGAGGNKRGGKN